LIVPLFVEDNDLTLPRCDDEQRRPGEDSSLLPGGGSARALSEPIRDHVGGLLFDRPNDCEMYSVIVGLHLVENNLADAFFDEHVDVGGISSAERDDATPSPVLDTSWKLIHDKISHDRWLTLVESILRRIHVVSMEHPLSEYAARQVPHLTAQELARVAAEALGVTSLPSSPPLSALAVQKKLRERSEPRLYAVVMDPGEEKTPVHSCVPTAVLELVRTDRETGVAVTALYDVEEDANLTASRLSDTDSVEEREGMMMRRTGRSCGCLRCRFETTTSEDLLGMTGPDATLLGRYYLSKGQLDTAKRLYRHAVEKSPDVADIWHALGAIELSEGHFLNAQRIWKQAAEKQPHACQEHEGISLQLEKIRAYSYLEPPQTGLPSDVTWESPVERAFVATVLDKATCEQVIRWAEQGTWTQQRHYAVPTHDVPVHTVPTLLQWFQNEFMPVACSLLAKQFDSTPNYYVHDAFCVRYEADKASNHLPVRKLR
jgi:tetratricopeptide (TPR) repeat protein